MAFWKQIQKMGTKLNDNITKSIADSKERDKGKALYHLGKELPSNATKLVSEGYYRAIKVEQDKKNELEKIKRDTEKLKLEQLREEAKLSKLKIEEQIKSTKQKMGGDGW